jgi:hypothetical protein
VRLVSTALETFDEDAGSGSARELPDWISARHAVAEGGALFTRMQSGSVLKSFPRNLFEARRRVLGLLSTRNDGEKLGPNNIRAAIDHFPFSSKSLARSRGKPTRGASRMISGRERAPWRACSVSTLSI